METKKILLVDNDPDYRETVQEFLERKGYQVLVASSLEEAITTAGQKYLDLAIFDVRLQDDADEKDLSGLVFAKQLDDTLPKIILTAYLEVTVDLVRELLSPANGSNVSLCSKREGLESLLRAVEAVIGPPARDELKVFLSYSPSDKTLALKIQARLKDSDLDVWYADREIFPGDNWAKIRGKALEESNAMVVLLSPDSLDDVKKDIEYALGNRAYEHRLIPVLVGDPKQIPQNKIPWILRRLNMITLPNNGQGEDLNQIVAALKAAA